MSVVSIDKARSLLLSNQVVAVPTETVYGLAGNAFDESAVDRIFAYKKRPRNHPLIVHTHGHYEAQKLISYWPADVHKLIDKYWPGPLTLLLPVRPNILAKNVLGGHGRVGIRVPDHPILLQLLRSISFPLAIPSANPFGYISPTTPAHVQKQLPGVPILDGGPCKLGLESTILGWENNKPIVYRLGSITIESLEDLLGPVQLTKEIASQAPGMLQGHYAPKKPLYFGDINDILPGLPGLRVGLLLFCDKVPNSAHQVILSTDKCLRTAAKNLFSAMHTLESMPIDVIVAERFPDEGFGKTINDRLYRAAVGTQSETVKTHTLTDSAPN